MKKIYFLLTVLILLYSCEKDGSLEETTAVKISQLEGKILTKQELLESNKKMAKVLERYEKPLSTHAANRTIDSNHYKILYDEIKYLENGDYHSYTFGIESNGPTGIVQNLLLSYQSDGTYKAFIVTYKLTQHEQDAILEGKKVNLEGKFSIGIIDSDINLILNKSQDVLYDKCPPGKCCEAYTSQATGWEILKIVSCIPSGGGSGDSGGTGTLDWPEYEDPGTDAGIGDDESGGTTGGGGGTSTGGDTSSDDPSCIADANGDCIGDTTTPLIPRPTAATKLISTLGLQPEYDQAKIDWLNTAAPEELKKMSIFLSENKYSTEAKEFAKEAIISLKDEGEVNYQNKFIKDPSFIGTKAECVLDQLVSSDNNIFRKSSEAFTGGRSKYRLKFTTYFNPNDPANARTPLPNLNGVIEIRFNLAMTALNSNSTALGLAADILHEVNHAELHRIKLSENSGPNPLTQVQYNYYIKLWDYFNKPGEYIGEVAGDAEHYFMAKNLIDPISDGLREFEKNSHSTSHYRHFAWQGLIRYGKLGGFITETELDENAILAKTVLNDNYISPCDK